MDTIIIPNEYECPISLEVMKDPVVASDGMSYERTEITRWFQTHDTSPVTGAICHTRLVCNINLRIRIREWQAKQRNSAVAVDRLTLALFNCTSSTQALSHLERFATLIDSFTTIDDSMLERCKRLSVCTSALTEEVKRSLSQLTSNVSTRLLAQTCAKLKVVQQERACQAKELERLRVADAVRAEEEDRLERSLVLLASLNLVAEAKVLVSKKMNKKKLFLDKTPTKTKVTKVNSLFFVIGVSLMMLVVVVSAAFRYGEHRGAAGGTLFLNDYYRLLATKVRVAHVVNIHNNQEQDEQVAIQEEEKNNSTSLHEYTYEEQDNDIEEYGIDDDDDDDEGDMVIEHEETNAMAGRASGIQAKLVALATAAEAKKMKTEQERREICLVSTMTMNVEMMQRTC